MIHKLDFSKVIKKIRKNRELTPGEKVLADIFKQYEGLRSAENKINIQEPEESTCQFCENSLAACPYCTDKGKE